MGGKGYSAEISGGNEEHVTEQWRQVILVINWQKNSAEVSSNVLWKVNLACCETGQLTEEITKRSDERAVWFLLTAQH